VINSPISSESVYGILRQYLRDRPDLGITKAVCDSVLQPLNPFNSKATRAPRRWFVLFVLLAGTLLGCFIYFNDLI
jgi:hypothetical protein